VDGVGNACHCGDVNGDDQVLSSDIVAIRPALAAPATLASTARCSVTGGTECDIDEAAALVRVLAGQKAKLANICGAAGHSGP